MKSILKGLKLKSIGWNERYEMDVKDEWVGTWFPYEKNLSTWEFRVQINNGGSHPTSKVFVFSMEILESFTFQSAINDCESIDIRVWTSPLSSPR